MWWHWESQKPQKLFCEQNQLSKVLSRRLWPIVGVYDHKDYNGTALVLGVNKETGELFEVYASHCSCFGLKDQWQPEATTLEYLKERFDEPDRILGLRYVPMTFEILLQEIKATIKQLEKHTPQKNGKRESLVFSR